MAIKILEIEEWGGEKRARCEFNFGEMWIPFGMLTQYGIGPAQIVAGATVQEKPRPKSGESERREVHDRAVRDRRAHRFSDSIGGDSSNYREPKFGRGE